MQYLRLLLLFGLVVFCDGYQKIRRGDQLGDSISGTLRARAEAASNSQNGVTDSRLGVCPNQGSSETNSLLSKTTDTEKNSPRALHSEKRRDARRSAVLRERSGLFRRAPQKLPFFDNKGGIARALYFQEKDDSLYLEDFTKKVVIGIASRGYMAAVAFSEKDVEGNHVPPRGPVLPPRAVPLASLLTIFMNRNDPGKIDADYLVFIFHTDLTEDEVEQLKTTLRAKLFPQLPDDHLPKKNGAKYIFVHQAQQGKVTLGHQSLEIKFQEASENPMIYLKDKDGGRETSCFSLKPED